MEDEEEEEETKKKAKRERKESEKQEQGRGWKEEREREEEGKENLREVGRGERGRRVFKLAKKTVTGITCYRLNLLSLGM